MTRPLGPEDVLERDPAASLEWRADGRLLCRHRSGTSLLDGLSRDELEAVVALVDGRRTAAELCTLLEPGLPRRRSRRILRLLYGELLVRRGGSDGSKGAEGNTTGLSTTRRRLRSVGVLGGGSAGHLCALALRRAFPELAITLIESPHVPVIGVGEATTPLMPQFLFSDLGVDPDDFWRSVRPTLKLGIRFAWGPTRKHAFPYPFGAIPVADAMAHEGHLRGAGFRASMLEGGHLPRPGSVDLPTEGLALGTEVAYHLDNRHFVAWLRRLAERRGIARIVSDIVDVGRDASAPPDSAPVAHLLTTDGRKLCFDLYIDCSGFRSLLIGEAMGSPWIDWESSLFNDRALVGTVPRRGTEAIRPYTEARAFSAGWCWNTPVREADHRGYVYSSAFLDDDDAEAEMRREIPGIGDLRGLRFRSGRRTHFWRTNVVALGNAYGFVEPLESTALHLLIRQIGWLLEGLGAGSGEGPSSPAPEDPLPCRLDERCGHAWDYLAWFLALHFRFNGAIDTPYWRACRGSADIERHRELVTAFARRGPLSLDPLLSQGFAYPDPLWGPEGIDVILFGQGITPGPYTPGVDRGTWQRHSATWRQALAPCPTHRVWLAEADGSPSFRRDHVAPFRGHGPAFPDAFQPSTRGSTLRNLSA